MSQSTKQQMIDKLYAEVVSVKAQLHNQEVSMNQIIVTLFGEDSDVSATDIISQIVTIKNGIDREKKIGEVVAQGLREENAKIWQALAAAMGDQQAFNQLKEALYRMTLPKDERYPKNYGF